MAVQLTSGALGVLANAFGSGSYAYNNLISAAQTSAYFADLLNTFAQNGGTMKLGVAGKGTGATGNNIVVDPNWVPKSNGTGENPLTFATSIAHELGHADLPKSLGEIGAGDGPAQASSVGETYEGMAVVAEYIVATQLGLPNGGATTHSDPQNSLTPKLNQIMSDSGVDVSQLRFDDFRSALKAAIGAPQWHGDVVAAFLDSIFGGGMNVLKPPYVIKVVNTVNLAPELQELIGDLSLAMKNMRMRRLVRTGEDVAASLEIAN